MGLSCFHVPSHPSASFASTPSATEMKKSQSQRQLERLKVMICCVIGSGTGPWLVAVREVKNKKEK